MPHTSAMNSPRSKRADGLDYGVLPGLIGYQLRRAQLAAFQHFAAATGGMTPGRFGVLTLIAANPGLSQSDLAAALGIDRSTLVPVIDELEAKRLVARRPSPSDRRTNTLHLTRQGAAARRDIERRVRRHEDELAAQLTTAQRRQLMALLARLTF